jgi:hypothetical protein
LRHHTTPHRTAPHHIMANSKDKPKKATNELKQVVLLETMQIKLVKNSLIH